MFEEEKDGFLQIEPLFGKGGAHHQLACSMMEKVLPSWFFSSTVDRQERIDSFREILPLFTWSEFRKEPYDLSFYILAPAWTGLYKFFFEMISCWLIPGKKVNIRYTTAIDFVIPDLGGATFTIAEAMLHLEEAADTAAIRRNLPTFESEIRLGAQSPYHARRILEIKGLASDEKTAMIQENIAELIRRRPRDFGSDIFAEMQHFMVMCSQSFKAQREYRHISRIISARYIFRRLLLETVEGPSPAKRPIAVKLMRARIRGIDGFRPVLGVFVAISDLRRNEVLEQQHLVRAISQSIPGVQPVEGSFLVSRNHSDHLCTLYLEVEKPTEEPFTFEEVDRLRSELAGDLRGCIEHQLHPVFMPRNEEEIMRSILTLGSQLKYVRDIPQVMVNFEEQTESELVFTVILLRVIKPGDCSIEELFATTPSELVYQHDAVKLVGLLRKRHPKEATVFRVRIQKERFLRSDHSIDLWRARQEVVLGLVDLVGEVRDFNGGMISKQDELLATLKKELGGMNRFDELLLENFFHSMTPVVMRSVLEPRLFQRFFSIFLSCLRERRESHTLEEGDFAAVMVTTNDGLCRESLIRAADGLIASSLELVSVDLEVGDTFCLGFLLRSDDPARRRSFLDSIGEALLEKEMSL